LFQGHTGTNYVKLNVTFSWRAVLCIAKNGIVTRMFIKGEELRSRR